MASKQKTPLMTDQQLHNGHHDEANGQDTEGSEVMLTTLETSSAKPNYDSISDKKVLLPGDMVMTRDEGTKYHILSLTHNEHTCIRLQIFATNQIL